MRPAQWEGGQHKRGWEHSTATRAGTESLTCARRFGQVGETERRRHLTATEWIPAAGSLDFKPVGTEVYVTGWEGDFIDEN